MARAEGFDHPRPMIVRDTATTLEPVHGETNGARGRKHINTALINILHKFPGYPITGLQLGELDRRIQTDLQIQAGQVAWLRGLRDFGTESRVLTGRIDTGEQQECE